MSERKEKLENLIKELSARALSLIDNHTSLITLTHADISPDMKNATIFISVLPENKEAQALHFVERNLGNIRENLKKNLNTKVIPHLSVRLDLGEKNRQRIEELLK